MNQRADETEQKLRGGYYTPLPIAQYLVDWAMHKSPERVLEPSCGDGIFLQAIADVGRRDQKMVTLDAVEYNDSEADKAMARARRFDQKSLDTRIYQADFFYWIMNGASHRRWGAIVGNPPYIRYQYFDVHQRDLAAAICHKAGISITKRTNAWVPFVAAAVHHLEAGGRLAMVVPAEILHVQHSHELRLLLEREMESVTIVSIRKIVFERTLQGTVLLLAIKRKDNVQMSTGPLFENQHQSRSASIQIVDVDDVESLNLLDITFDTHRDSASNSSFMGHSYGGEWMQALLRPEERELIGRTLDSSVVSRFDEIAKAPVGIVTGANNFFVVDEETVEKYALNSIASPMLARASLIDGLTYRAEDHRRNATAGRSVYFLDFPEVAKEELPGRMREYIEKGEAQNLHLRYKCRIREPWYKVPSVWTSKLSLLKRCHYYPRLVVNELGAYSTDTAYRVSLNPKYAGKELDLAYSFLNSLTLLHAEILGRHYGGGVLELVPSETAALPLALTKVSQRDFKQVDELIRSGGSMEKVLSLTDNNILGREVGLSSREIEIIKGAHRRLLRRRLREE